MAGAGSERRAGKPAGSSARLSPAGAGLARIHVFFSGHVQGVGMRATVCDLAPDHGVTGWVRNLEDGRVEVLAEGKREHLEDFLSTLRRHMSYYVRSVEQTWETPTGEFRGFSVLFL
jgi:acylphosphatase